MMAWQPVDFTILKHQTTQFLSAFYSQLFVSSQVSTPMPRKADTEDLAMNKNRAAVEEIFIKATGMQTLAMGLVYLLSSSFATTGSNRFIVNGFSSVNFLLFIMTIILPIPVYLLWTQDIGPEV